jgi:3'(2'), 5'-bisphosphate nucleotidase
MAFSAAVSAAPFRLPDRPPMARASILKPVFERELEIAVAAVREAAMLCRKVREAVSPETLLTGDRSPVTVADFGSQALVCAALQEAFPDDPVVAEEGADALRQEEHASLRDQVLKYVGMFRADADSERIDRWIDHGSCRTYGDRFWTLDPIDGTKGFLRGDQYAVALALIVDGQPELGVLACPGLDQGGLLLAARRGFGTVRYALPEDSAQLPVRVSTISDLTRARICESFEKAHSSRSGSSAVAARLGIQPEPLRLDSQAKYALVATGAAEIYLRLPTRADYVEKIWDHAAGALVVTEAGGTVTDVEGRPLDFTHGYELRANRGVVATNGLVHEPVLEAIEPAVEA